MVTEDASEGAVQSMRAALLRVIKSDLDLLILPGLAAPEARMAVELASEMLSFLIVADRDLAGVPATLNPRLTALVQRADVLCAVLGVQAQPAVPFAVASELIDDGDFSRLAARLAEQLSALLAMQEISALHNVGEGMGERAGVLTSAASFFEAREQIAALATDAVALEYDRLKLEHALVTREMADRSDHVAAVEIEITVARLQSYFDVRMSEQEAGTVEHVERVPGGYSKDTWRLRLTRGIAGQRALILRRDLPFGPGENTVTEEYALLNFLADAGLAVPRPLWQEADPLPLGRPFLLFAELPGKAVFGQWHAEPADRRRIVLQVAQLMARLHALDPFAAGIVDAAAARRTPRETVQAYVRHWRDKWLRRRIHPSLILETAFDWLLRNTPQHLDRVSIVHSDISFRNTLIEAGELQALLDWEFWHLGDAMEDLSYFRLVAEPYVEWDVVMDTYQAAGGIAYDSERAAFYEVWRSVRNATTTTTAWNGFLSGAYPASKAAYQGVSLYRLFLRDVADKLGNVQL